MRSIFVLLGALFLAMPVAALASAGGPPVYVHTNGANDFLEQVVVRPGEPVVFVNEDTGHHTVIGYDPQTGAILPTLDGVLLGTPGPGHPVHTYRVTFSKPGLYFYYCSVHAHLVRVYHKVVAAVPRKGIHGYGGPMAGLIIVTRSKALLREDPKTSHQRILPDFFGG